jgi:pentatricopeptide repeat protein
MQSDFKSGKNKNCHPDIHTYNTILNELLKSNLLDAAEKAEKIFNAISLPDTVVYNTFINILAKKGDVARVLNMLQRKKLDFGAGHKKGRCPNARTYTIALKALQKSNQSDAVETAEQIFASIDLPDSFTFNSMINLYAERGMGAQAVSLVRRMQRDFASGTNRACMPDKVTKSTLLKALRITNDSAVKSEAKVVLDWFDKKPNSRSN